MHSLKQSKMNLKKRTIEELRDAVSRKDYTGGYNFIAWLIWIENIKAITILALFIASIGCFSSLSVSYDVGAQLGVGIGAFVSSAFLGYLTRKQYKDLKNGISK